MIITPKAVLTYRCERLGYNKPNERDLTFYSLGWEDSLRVLREEISAMLTKSIADTSKRDGGDSNES